MSMNFSDNVDVVGAQQASYRINAGRAPGVDRYAVMQRYFGRQPVDPQNRYGENVNYTNYDYPDLKKGKNLYLRDTIEGYILSDIEWYTRVLPWLETDDLHIKFNTFKFQTTLATPVPNEGISRLISSSSRTFEDSVERLGIGFIMEGDLLGTPEGEQQFRRNIAGIAQCCQETTNYHTLVALLTCKDYIRELQDLYSKRDMTLARIEQREASRFAILAQSAEGFDRMVEEEKKRIQDHRGRADTLIVFPRFPYTESMVRQGTLTRYFQMGPDGIQRFVDGPESVGTFRGIPIFETRDFSVYDNEDRAQPLIRDVAVGEYYNMSWGAYRDRVYDGFETDHRSLYIYDFPDDTWRKITFLEALKECRAWGGDSMADDHDKLNPKTYELAEMVNRQLRQNGAFEQFAKYSEPQRFESLVGESFPDRSLYMMLAVDYANHRVFPAEWIGQLDVDVYTTKDLRNSALTALQRIAGRQCAAVSEALSDVFALVREWENEPYKKAYFDALAEANIARSVDSQGQFIGEKAGIVQWASNAYGGLDLPVYQNTMGQWPAGMANWAGMQTYAAQAQSKNWPNDGDKLQRVNAAIEAVRNLTISLHETFMLSHALKPEYTAEWFANRRDTELAVFELLYHVRPPMFLRAPTGKRGTASGGKRDGDDGGIDYNPVFISPSDFLGGMPALTQIDNVLGTFGEVDAATLKTTLEKFFSALSDVTPGKLVEAEAARAALVNALFERIASHGGDETLAKFVIDATANYVVQNLVLEAGVADDEKIKRATDIAKRIKKETQKVLSEARKQYAGAKNQDELRKVGKEIIDFQQPDTKILAGYNNQPVQQGQGGQQRGQGGQQRGQGGRQTTGGGDVPRQRGGLAPAPLPFAIVEPVKRAVLGIANERNETFLDQLRAASEQLDAVGRKYQKLATFSWDAAGMEAWAQALVQSQKLNKDEFAELQSVCNAYQQAVAAVQQQIDAAMPQQQPLHRDDDAFEDAGAAISPKTDNQFFFRAPLTMTQNLVRDIAKLDDPAIRPADARTGFRTIFNPWSQGANGQAARINPRAPYNAVDAVLKHPAMAASNMGRFSSKSKMFFQTSMAAALCVRPDVPDEHFGAHEYRAPVELRGGLVNDHIDIDMSPAGEQGFETAADRFMRQAEETNRRRQAQGLRPREFGDDIAMAAQRAREEARNERLRDEMQRYREAAQSKAGASALSYDEQAAQIQARGAVSTAGSRMSLNPIEQFQAMNKALQSGDAYGSGQQQGAAAPGSHAERVQAQYMANQTFQYQVSAELQKMTRGHFPYRWNKAQDETDPLVRMVMQLILLLPNRYSSWRSLAENNVNPPCNIVIHRPFIELRMFTCIIMQSGYETGFNVIGPSNMAISSTSADKMIHGAFTYYQASMVINEKFVGHLRDVYPMGYIAGWGTRPVRTADELKRRDRGDWISTIIPITENALPPRITIIATDYERLLPADTNRPRQSGLRNYSAAAFFELVWGINERNINFRADLHKYHLQSQMINVREAAGKCVRFDKTERRFTRVDEGKGHLAGNKSGPGVRDVWFGYADTLFPDQSMKPINLP